MNAVETWPDAGVIYERNNVCRVYLSPDFYPERYHCPRRGGEFEVTASQAGSILSVLYSCRCSELEGDSQMTTLEVEEIRREPDGRQSGEIPRWLYEVGVATGGDPTILSTRQVTSPAQQLVARNSALVLDTKRCLPPEVHFFPRAWDGPCQCGAEPVPDANMEMVRKYGISCRFTQRHYDSQSDHLNELHLSIHPECVYGMVIARQDVEALQVVLVRVSPRHYWCVAPPQDATDESGGHL
jgi:hypothetical protein